VWIHQFRCEQDRAVGGKQHGVAIGRRADYERGANDAAGACLVLDDKCLVQFFLLALRHNTRDYVGVATGRIGHNQPLCVLKTPSALIMGPINTTKPILRRKEIRIFDADL
jgi:hypothetical protein